MTRNHRVTYHCEACGVLIGMALCGCGGYDECRYDRDDGPPELCVDCAADTVVEMDAA